ncbi:hypothetical protein [Amycolatopsis vancoresmycina]|uniref:Uncharacterized protein n=1 Tax=Amycolatopsis vancoresmycina DSM 44592 TaxID=1292037 RepID=R1I4G2_9PSEU|nr:hypothetical protein [Amycolatopsis vancoresmycina]EOD65364.1 hypothetical protein H480_27042 [Amycolatopsis vancoresmycina DSM 44592]
MTTGQQPVPTRPATPYSQGKRAFYGLTWTFWTIALIAAAFTMFTTDLVGQGLLALAVSGATGYYAYRIWTWQARRLIFFIIF